MTFVRRNFLIGAGGAALALPLLESLAPRTARGQALPPPKRLLVVLHPYGRFVGGAPPFSSGDPSRLDLWSPGSTTRPLTVGEAPSPLLAELAPIANEIVTLDGVDNIVAHAGDVDPSWNPLQSCLTCRPGVDAGEPLPVPSFDYVTGERLRSGTSMPASLVVSMSATPLGTVFDEPRCGGSGGAAPAYISGNPQQAAVELFGSLTPTPTDPTLRGRLARNRRGLLDGVLGAFQSLRGRVSIRDRDRLDRHAEFLRDLQMRISTGAPSCSPPDAAEMPHVVPSNWEEFTMTGRLPDWERGRRDDVTVPWQVENIVQALACDVVRSCVVSLCNDPTFASEFPPGGNPFEESYSVRQTISTVPRDYGGEAHQNITDLSRGFQLYAREVRWLIERLAAVEDVDGSRLLDNTLVLWTSELGFGPQNLYNDVPIVLAGMRSAFTSGQGRHVVMNRRTLGDLFAEVLRKLGFDDTTYGATGTLGALADAGGVTDLQPSHGWPGAITRDTPLHMGPLDL